MIQLKKIHFILATSSNFTLCREILTFPLNINAYRCESKLLIIIILKLGVIGLISLTVLVKIIRITEN